MVNGSVISAAAKGLIRGNQHCIKGIIPLSPHMVWLKLIDSIINPHLVQTSQQLKLPLTRKQYSCGMFSAARKQKEFLRDVLYI